MGTILTRLTTIKNKVAKKKRKLITKMSNILMGNVVDPAAVTYLSSEMISFIYVFIY